jgi:hypothetical protein
MTKFFYKAPNFKKISSILLLFVFILGITPRKTQQLTKAGFNCKCDDLVAEAHFITFSSLVVVNIPSVHSFVSFCIPSFVSLSLFHNNLRGPPLKF